MLGEPTTPLFSISDFISLELYQVRAFDTSATSWRSSTSLGSSVLRNTLLLVMPADVRFFSFPPNVAIKYTDWRGMGTRAAIAVRGFEAQGPVHFCPKEWLQDGWLDKPKGR
jgi:hypothetical protein